MSTLIPSMSITDFKKLKVSELKRLKSLEILSDGEYLATIVFSKTDYIRIRVEGFAHLSNTQGGEDPENILRKKEVEYAGRE